VSISLENLIAATLVAWLALSLILIGLEIW